MFGKKKQDEAKPKGGKLSPKDIIANQIEQLGAGQSLSYRLPEAFGGYLMVVELNPDYPAKGKGQKYIVSRDEIVEGKPAGERTLLFDENKPKEIAGAILDRYGELFS